jgi:hypothetical protein
MDGDITVSFNHLVATEGTEKANFLKSKDDLEKKLSFSERSNCSKMRRRNRRESSQLKQAQTFCEANVKSEVFSEEAQSRSRRYFRSATFSKFRSGSGSKMENLNTNHMLETASFNETTTCYSCKRKIWTRFSLIEMNSIFSMNLKFIFLGKHINAKSVCWFVIKNV